MVNPSGTEARLWKERACSTASSSTARNAGDAPAAVLRPSRRSRDGEADLENAALSTPRRSSLRQQAPLRQGRCLRPLMLRGRTFAKPFILAGGLSTLAGAGGGPPFGVDLNRGRGRPGVKNRVKLAVAVATVRDFDTSERREHR